jgi:hypothetical protein
MGWPPVLPSIAAGGGRRPNPADGHTLVILDGEADVTVRSQLLAALTAPAVAAMEAGG